MVTIRSANDIILSLIDFLRINQPELDTKTGTVARDLFVEAPASQLSLLYDELSKLTNLQSMRLASGTDLDNWAANFGATRKSSRKASGIALFTFASIPASIPLNKNALIFSNSGQSFGITTGLSVSPVFTNLYKSIATKYRNELDFLGISDQYAVEVLVTCTTPGTSGNLAKYSINRTNIPGVSHVTNIFPFSRGSNQEDDNTFRNRVLATFSGSNIGTSLGYRNAVLQDESVTDALVIEPGDPLMQRDGTEVTENTDGSYTIVSEGNGGKVDVIVLGSRESENIDSFIYRDASNNNDPTDEKNIIVLGQISGDENKTVSRRRIDNLADKTLPAQPVDQIIEVTGSLSGSNYIAKSVDSLGRVRGNYELIKDTGVYSGSPWGFDKFHWISDRITDFSEDRVKGKVNGQDNVSFSDVLAVSEVQQQVQIQNENSTVTSSDRSIIQLLHFPVSNVTRVFNSTTGELYTVVTQNLDGTGGINQTGRIRITGNTLPSTSDILQVDYTWVFNYDSYVDFDGMELKNNPRVVEDSVDWGYSNAITNERIKFTLDGYSNFYTGSVTHPISAVVSAKYFKSATANVELVTSGVFLGKLAVVISNLVDPITTIDSIKLSNTNKEAYNTAAADGSFSNQKVIIGSLIRYQCTIILPTDSVALTGNSVDVTFDAVDAFTVGGVTGNFSQKQIMLPAGNNSSGGASFFADVNYVANIQDLLVANITQLPLSRKGNGYSLNSQVSSGLSDASSTILRENATIAINGSGLYAKIQVSSLQFGLTAESIISVVRISDGVELWNSAHVGTVDIDSTDKMYRLYLTPSYHSPTVGEQVLVVYQVTDTTRTQPLTFSTTALSTQTGIVTYDAVNNLFSITGLTIPSNLEKNQILVFKSVDGSELSDSGMTVLSSSGTVLLSSAKTSALSGGEFVTVVYYSTKSLRHGFSRISASLTDQANNQGILTVTGTTISKIDSVIFTATNSGLTQNISEAVRKALALNSTASLDSRFKLTRLVKLEKVNVIGTEVISVAAKYDVLDTKIQDSGLFSDEAITNAALGKLDFTLPSSENNVTNAPALGDALRITCYYSVSNDSENLFFTRNGTVIGNKKFALVDKVVVSSGFNTSSTARLLLSFTNQPTTTSRYNVTYDYLGPKPNERILIRSTYNQLIGDVSIDLEPKRPINADVLIKAANQKLINVTMFVVVKPEFLTSSDNVIQNVQNKVISFISTNELGGTLDSSDLINIAYAVDGVDRVRITGFNQDGKTGQTLSITAQKNEYFVANTISVTAENR